jgi:hypothetical protein
MFAVSLAEVVSAMATWSARTASLSELPIPTAAAVPVCIVPMTRENATMKRPIARDA